MFGRFLKEEKGQGAIEYIILMGGIILAAVLIFNVYSSMTKSSATSLNESAGSKIEEMQNTIGAQSIE